MVAMNSDSTLAIAGGEKAVTLTPPTWPVVEESDVERMSEVVRSGNWSWIGPQEQAFCEEYRQFIGTEYCTCLANGTVTIQCALQAVGVEPGHEVIVPALTWVATAQAAMDIGANVVLVDVDPETLVIDPAGIEAAITPKTKAIIPVHLYGCMCDMDAIMAIAKKHDLKIVEDVAHQQGSRWRDKGAGGIGDAGSYSFQQSKVLTCGEGGAVTCNDKDIYEVVFALKQVGWMPANAEESHFDNLVPGNHYGHNYRITEMQAALLRGGLGRLEDQTMTREARATQIRQGLDQIGGPLRAVKRDDRVTRQAYYAMTLYYDPEKADGLTRQGFLEALSAEGCPLSIPYDPVHRNKLLNLYDSTSPIPYRDPATVQDYRNLNAPNTERACTETGVVLSHTHMLGSEEYVDQLLLAVKKVSDNMEVARSISETS